MHGATDVNERLARAAKLGELSALTQALEGGADAKCHDSTALQCAAVRGHVECVALLSPVSEKLTEAVAEARGRGEAEVAGMIEAFIEAKALSGAIGNPKGSHRVMLSL